MMTETPELAPVAYQAPAGETLSQFSARVLDQLSLSAWLPSALLTLGLAWTYQVAIEHRVTRGDLLSSGAAAARSLAEISLGGALLLFSLVVIVAMLTQAFSFDAIQLFEGYWGRRWPFRQVAEAWANSSELRAKRLRREREDVLTLAFRSAEDEVRRVLEHAAGARVAVDPERVKAIIKFLELSIRGRSTLQAPVSKVEAIAAAQIPWRRFASPQLNRDLALIESRLADYPRRGRCLPTMLGNVLRAWEDATNDPHVKTLVLRRYDRLSPTVRTRHDQYRNRLDLYCSLIVVSCLLTGALTLAVRTDIMDVIAVVTLGFAGALFAYRAAIASARVYGVLLVNIATTVQGQIGQQVPGG